MITLTPWWRHQMETFPRNWPFVRGIHLSPVSSPHKGQWRGALMFFFDLRLYKRLSKQSSGWWFETLPSPLWRHCNENKILRCNYSSLFYLKWRFSGTSNTVQAWISNYIPLKTMGCNYFFMVSDQLCLQKKHNFASCFSQWQINQMGAQITFLFVHFSES